MKKMLILIMIIILVGCSNLKNADNAENNTLNKSPETEITFSDIVEVSSVICTGKIIDSRDIDKNIKAVNIAVTSEYKGTIDDTSIELYTQESLKSGYIYVFFLYENSAKNKEGIDYDLLSVASFYEHDDNTMSIVYDETLNLDVDYKNIDEISELKEYIQKESFLQEQMDGSEEQQDLD